MVYETTFSFQPSHCHQGLSFFFKHLSIIYTRLVDCVLEIKLCPRKNTVFDTVCDMSTQVPLGDMDQYIFRNIINCVAMPQQGSFSLLGALLV